MYKVPDKNVYVVFDLSTVNNLDVYKQPYTWWFKTKQEALRFIKVQKDMFPKAKLSQPKFVCFYKDYLFSE